MSMPKLGEFPSFSAVFILLVLTMLENDGAQGENLG